MQATYQNLKHLRDERALISIWREEYDSQGIQAFVIHFSDTLVLLQYIYDFYVDGYFLVRIEDITEIETTTADEFRKSLLIEEGFFSKIDFNYKPPIDSYDEFLRSLSEDEIVILEDEAADISKFFIGRLISVDADEVSIRFLTGDGNWEEKPSQIGIDRITCCQIKTNYTNFYARHFSRINA